MAHTRRTWILAAICFAIVLPVLVLVPTLFPTDPTVLSAAGLEGYSTVWAYRSAVIWSVLALALAAFATRIGWLDLEFDDRYLRSGTRVGAMSSRAKWMERGVVAQIGRAHV